MFDFLKKLFGSEPEGTLTLEDLCRRLRISESELRGTPVVYHKFAIPKRSGGMREILAPDPLLKNLQRRILHLLLRQLRAHPNARGFERGQSIVTNALPHVGRKVIIKLDLKDFFASTSAKRVDSYFRNIGWNAEAAALLTRLCTENGSLPQGAPTSPRLSNLVNYRIDARLTALATERGVSFSRYADDITFSGGDITRIREIIRATKLIVEEYGYRLHTDKKLRIARSHDRQLVTGLVVNQKVSLPRSTRRRLRAIEHRMARSGSATLTAEQIAGWKSLVAMIAAQSNEK